MFQTVSRKPRSSLIARCLANRLAHCDDLKETVVRNQVSRNWTGKIKSALTKFAVAGALSLCSAVSAVAGSYTQPGSTIGPPAGAPLPPGLFFSDWITQGSRTSPSDLHLGDNIAVLIWSTPWTIAGARVQLIVAPVIPVWYGEHGVSSSGLYDPFVAAQFAWDLGQGWGCQLHARILYRHPRHNFQQLELGQSTLRAELHRQRLEPDHEQYLGHRRPPAHQLPARIALPDVRRPKGAIRTFITTISPRPRPSAIGSWARSPIIQPI